MSERMPDDFERTYVPDRLPTPRTVASLLSALDAKAAEPIDALIDRLAAGQSAAGLLDGWTGQDAWPAGRWRELIAGQMSEAEIEAAKRAAKKGFAQAESGRQASGRGGRDAALLGYLLTLAAGQVHRGRLPSSMPAEVVEDWLTAVAGVAEPPVGPLLQQAAEALAGASRS